MATLSFPNYNFSSTDNLEPTDNFNAIKLSRKKRDSCATQAAIDVLEKTINVGLSVGNIAGASALASFTGSLFSFHSPTTCDLDAKMDQLLVKLNKIIDKVDNIGTVVECAHIKQHYREIKLKIRPLLSVFHDFYKTNEKEEARQEIISRCKDHTQGIRTIHSTFLTLLDNDAVVDYFKNCARYESENINIWGSKVNELTQTIIGLFKGCEEASDSVTQFDPPRFEKEVKELTQFYSEVTNLEEFVKDKNSGLKNIVQTIANKGKSAIETAQILKEKFNYFNWDVIFYSSTISGYQNQATFYEPDSTYCGSQFYNRELDHDRNALVAWCIPNNMNPNTIKISSNNIDHAEKTAKRIYDENQHGSQWLNYVLAFKYDECKSSSVDYNGKGSNTGRMADTRKLMDTHYQHHTSCYYGCYTHCIGRFIFASWMAYKNKMEKPSLTTTGISFKQGGKKVITKYNTRLFGHYKQYTEKDDYKCLQACKSEEKCAAATFHAPYLYNCFFFGKGFTKSVESGWTSYIKHEEWVSISKHKNESLSSLNTVQVSYRYDGIRLANHFQYIKVESATKCFEECQKNKECEAITFRPVNNDGCHLYRKGEYVAGLDSEWVSISNNIIHI
ncbi:unnamed protein product [Rotaria socialis]|uniref:Apple domain-containing protein n=4 Tax=Rotaria socialis TaxID=392032 RepID=A0A818NF05_9BILA|nr:unnamed protein product [Rotaria socialis]CAF3715527.1 unnamed protein product [Rotaria socialis]CAF4508844.1 unnamed protein product [Rotaria socialis]